MEQKCKRKFNWFWWSACLRPLINNDSVWKIASLCRRSALIHISKTQKFFYFSLLSLSHILTLSFLPLSSLYPSLSQSPPSLPLSLSLYDSLSSPSLLNLCLSHSSLFVVSNIEERFGGNYRLDIFIENWFPFLDYFTKNGEYFVKEQQGFFAKTVKHMDNDHIRDPNFVLVVLGRALLFRGSLMLYKWDHKVMPSASIVKLSLFGLTVWLGASLVYHLV